jgi:thiamine-monophosphate kinase
MPAGGGPLVGDVGELGLLDAIRPYLATSGGVAGGVLTIGAGDDAAAWEPPSARAIVTTTDSLVEEVHFHRPTDPGVAGDVGWKLLAVSFSDLAAMAALPGPAFISLALPPEWPLAWVDAMYREMARLCQEHGAVIAGGNITSAAAAVLTSTCLGVAEPSRILRRDGARPGWALAVTGRLGGAAAALRLAHDPDAVPRLGAAGEEAQAAWRARLRRPEPRLSAGAALTAAGIRVALDVSDGLYVDAGRLLGAGGAGGLLLDAAALPVEVGVREAWPGAWLDVVGGGEDYELLFAGPPEMVDRACRALGGQGLEAVRIGTFDEGLGERVLVDGEERPAPAVGHLHFGG